MKIHILKKKSIPFNVNNITDVLENQNKLKSLTYN